MAFLDEQGLQRLADKINVRASSTLPNNAPDGTIIINPDEDTEIFNVDNINIDVDSALSLTSTNPVQNKVVTKELERIPYKLTVKCVGFDGGIVNPGYEATGSIQLCLSNYKDFSKADIDYGRINDLSLYESYMFDNEIQKTVYKGTPYTIRVYIQPSAVGFNDYYDPDQTEINGVITEDTNIIITFQQKREPVTLTINLKDKNGNYVSDDVSIVDSFDRTTTKTAGTYGKTAEAFTVQVTKGRDYEITPLLKGYNNKENNSPADPDQTSISGTANNDETINITYNKIYPDDFGTAWTDLHKTISENQGVEVLPIGTELSTYMIDTNESGTAHIPIKFHIVNWRYAEKEDGSQVWGCDLLSTGNFLPISSFSGVYFFNSDASTTMNGWEDSTFREFFNNSKMMSDAYPVDFLKYLQKVKVTSSITKDTPVYTYDTMWLPSATEMYIDTAQTKGLHAFTNVVEGNNNEKYWKNIIKASSKFDPSIANNKLIDLNADEPSIHLNYWLRSCAFMLIANPSGDNTYSYQKEIWYVTNEGKMEFGVGTDGLAYARVMCFLA